MKQSSILFILLTFLISCGSQHSEGVQLNDGAKWQANAETTQGIANMVSLVTIAQQANSPNIAQLQRQLQEEFTMIFQKCSMKGEAHNQLHNFLHPLKGHIDNVSFKNLNELAEYLDGYQRYFQ